MASKEDRSICNALVERAQAGDAEAFAGLYALYKRRTYLICFGMVRNDADAEDIMQEAFIHLFQNIKKFRGDALFSTWLHRLVVRVTLTHIRKQKGKKCLSIDDPIETQEGTFQKQIAFIDHYQALTTDRVALENAFVRLSLKHQTILYLYDVLGHTHPEIVKILGVSLSNSKSRLHHARKRMLDHLNGDR